MDDLNGLDWSANASSKAKQPPSGTGNYYPTLRPTPTPPPAFSGRSTPLSAQGSGIQKSASSALKASTTDSFSNLVSFGSAKQTNNLTLQEQQAKLQVERARKAEEQKKQYNAQFGNSQFWDGLGTKPVSGASPFGTSQSTTPVLQPISSRTQSPFAPKQPAMAVSQDDDLFAAFNKDTAVDKSSHYPPPSLPNSGKSTPAPAASGNRLDLNDPKAWQKTTKDDGVGLDDDDDDPFGLNQLAARRTVPVQSQNIGDEDDFLGDLGKPVDQVKKVAPPKPAVVAEGPDSDEGESDDPWDKAVGELVDMGFSAEQSRRALTESGSGLDIQAAVSWLLNDAHRQAKEKSQSRTGSARPEDQRVKTSSSRREDSGDRARGDAVPPWMRQDSRDRSGLRRDESKSPANSDGDLTKIAAAAGSNLLKTANSLWKTSQKKVQKAVSEFQQEPDSSQPKWMRATPGEREGRSGRQGNATSNVTDEAMMLEANGRPQNRRPKPATESRYPAQDSNSSRDQSPAMSAPSTGRSTPAPKWQQSAQMPIHDAKSRLKQAVEEQSAQAYVSPARRKKATPLPVEEPDLLFSDSNLSASRTPEPTIRSPATRNAPTNPSRPVASPAPITIRPKAPTRNIPTLSPSALASSTQHRLAGTEHYKRGDYAAAHASYSTSLSALPQGHPITIVLLCNRSMTALKTGEPKQAVTDADDAIKLIGPSRGDSEEIDLQGQGAGEGKKQMKEFWGKALMRKAEALEQMERWMDAGGVWKEAVEAGVGGATATQGRQRCERALAPKPKPIARPAQKAPPRPKPSAINDLGPSSGQNSEAVNRMRAANAAAEKADDEKFALSDSIDAKVGNWREGRKDNLRALLGGLDQVLWDGSGWKKIGMHELVMNSKVKINYMKAIAKVHPDKLPQDASVEVQMISAAVFATLNEAWDKFKTDNNM